MNPTKSFFYPITEQMVRDFGAASGDQNPIHFDERYAATTRFGRRISQGALTIGLVSASLWRAFGDGVIYLKQSAKFVSPVHIGETVRLELATVAVERGRHTLATNGYVGDRPVMVGEAVVMVEGAPA
jgi:3-hydroxybutyryl-CoA dehydratase